MYMSEVIMTSPRKEQQAAGGIHSHLVVEDFGFTGRSMNDEMVFEHGEHVFAGALQLLLDLSHETMTSSRAVHTIYSC